jgi:predicted small secreted protein
MLERVLKIIKFLFKHRQPMVNSWIELKELKLLGTILNRWGGVG